MSPAKVVQLAGSPSSAGRVRGLRDLGITCTRLGIEDVGFGSVAWLRIEPGLSGLRTITVRANAGSSGVEALRIGETGQVPELEIENRGTEALLLPAHLVLAGGWQTRSVERSVVVAGGVSARVPVKCVEAGRWAPRDEKTGSSFEVSDRTGVRTRWSTSRSMADQLHFTGRFAAEQSAVWQHVDEELARSPIGSRTRSYEAYLRGVKQPFLAEARQAGVKPPAGANAVAILPRSGGFWLEAYPTEEGLGEQLEDLLADLFDPAVRGERAEGPGQLVPALQALLDGLWAAPLRPLDRIAGTLGDAYALAGASFDALPGHEAAGAAALPPGLDPVGAALVIDGKLAHLGIGSAPAGARKGSEASVLKAADASSGVGAASPVPSAHVHGPRTSAGSSSSMRAVAEPAPAPRSMRAVPAIGAEGEGKGAAERPRVDLETMRGIYARARDLLPEGPLARERVQGYRLVRVLDRNISWVDVRIVQGSGSDGYAVLGSHDRCDLVLSSDSGVWLRHLAAICVRLDDDVIGLRLIDLKTDLPFFLDDETPRWSITATGPFAMRLGRHVVCGFPIGPATGEEPVSPPALKGAVSTSPGSNALERRFNDAAATGVIESLLTSGGELPVPAVHVAPPLQEITSFVPSAPVSQIQDLLGPSASPDHVRVTLERGGMGASVELPADALEAGVLLGRALNCFDGGLRRIFCEAISRAHVLLVRDHGEVHAFDLCSTNGTRVGGQRIRRHRLNDSGTTLELGKKVIFRWRR
jgi:hypothetical protein